MSRPFGSKNKSTTKKPLHRTASKPKAKYAGQSKFKKEFRTGKSTGVRYSDAQRKRMVDFVKAYDKKHGKGGMTTACKKFGISYTSLIRFV